MHPVLLLAIISAAALTLLVGGNLLAGTPLVGQENVATAASLPFRVDLHEPPDVKVGDAVYGNPYFRVEPHWMDNFGERHCEECMMVEFTPRGQGFVGAAFLADKVYDFSEAKRAVFFVMGENGGEEVAFGFVGTDKTANGKPVINNPANATEEIFVDQEFGVKTKKITLEKDLQRYEVSLEGVDPDMMKQTKYPFGFHVGPKSDSSTVRFYITGVFIDTEETKRPVPLEEPVPAEK